MTYRYIGGRYVFWNDEIMIPFRTKEGKKAYFKKEVPFEEAPNYWEYIEEDGGFAMYYIKRGVDRRLARCNMPHYRPEGIIAMLKDRVISVHDCSLVEERTGGIRGPKKLVTSNWAVEWDDKPILLLVMQKPKMSYAEIVRVITNEGGFVDGDGIIHKGSAVNKIIEI